MRTSVAWCSDRRKRSRGISLITTALCLVVMIGALGLALDLGRMYVIKNELQAYADAAAITAALEMDGTATGLVRAENAGLAGPSGTPNQWNFDTETIPAAGIQVRFSKTSTGGWTARGAIGAASGYKFVRVAASRNLPLAFMPVLGIPASQGISAASVAGQALIAGCANGTCDPFAPIAPNKNLTNFGFIQGSLYTLKWAPNGQRKPGTTGYCTGDTAAGTSEPNENQDRGYIDLGQGNGNSALRDAILNRDYSPAVTLHIGDEVDNVPGNKSVGSASGAVGQRVDQDTDQASATWAQYAAAGVGNGRRLFHVPVQDSNGIVIGFATFFMQTAPRSVCLGNSDACCAEFVGMGAVDGSRWGSADTNPTQFYAVRLFPGGGV